MTERMTRDEIIQLVRNAAGSDGGYWQCLYSNMLIQIADQSLDLEDNPECRNCRFWGKHPEKAHPDDTQGKCTRFPPVLLPHGDVDDTDNFGWWCQPYTHNDDLCGEFQPKKT